MPLELQASSFRPSGLIDELYGGHEDE